jgi:hypothetical protein
MVLPRRLSRKRRVLLLVTLVVAGSTGILAAAELAARVRHKIQHGDLWGIEETYSVDPASGLRVPVVGRSFGGIRINSLGFRSPEISRPKPASTVRLAFLGSSTTYSAEVSSNEKTWPHLVTEALQRHWPEVTFDYINNAGVPGYSVQHTLRNLEHRVAPLEPDVVVIYEGFNDLSGNGFHLAASKGSLLSRRRGH